MDLADIDRLQSTRYANLAEGWVGFASVGVQQVGSAKELRLDSIPDAGVPGGPQVIPPAGPAPAGVALDACGTGFVSLPDSSRVVRVTRCAPPAIPAGELLGTRIGDTDVLPGTFIAPRGLSLGPRGRLYIADTDAMIVIDPTTGTITGRRMDVVQGWCVAGVHSAVFLLDRGGAAGRGRVRRFDADGHEDAAFTVAAAAALSGDPVRMAALGDRLLVVTRGPYRDAVVALNLDGTLNSVWSTPARVDRDPVTGAPTNTPITRIAGIAGSDKHLYLVDLASGDLLSFTTDGAYVGSTRPTRPVSDVWSAGTGALWAYPAAAGALSLHNTNGAWLRSGTFVCGPLETGTLHDIRELRAWAHIPGGAHLQLWTAVTLADIPPAPETVPVAAGPTGPWSALPPDVDVALVTDPAGPKLWVAGHLSGDGAATPVVHQIGVSGARSWLDWLPAVYRKDPSAADFLDRFLRLLHSIEDETTQQRTALVRRFDPWTADDTRDGSGGNTTLDDLAGWLAVTLNETWPESLRRTVVARAFAAQAVQATPAGLRAAIEQRYPPPTEDPSARLRVEITHPAQRAHIWSLPDEERLTAESCSGGLGFDTMLAAAPAGGAVVGVNAVVDQSTLTGGADAGGPLFADLAHRFHVAVVPEPGRDVSTLDSELRALIDAEKPAHTVYSLCIAGPRARVGMQARIGMDAIVAGPPPALDLDNDTGLDFAIFAYPKQTADKPAAALLGQTRLGRGRLT